MNVRELVLVLMLVCPPSSAASNPQDPGTQGTKPDPPPDSTPSLTWHGERIYFGLDLSLASVQDESLRESMGRERQVKLAFAVFSAYGDLGDHFSYRIEANPADDAVVPRPHIPSLEDRRRTSSRISPTSPAREV